MMRAERESKEASGGGMGDSASPPGAVWPQPGRFAMEPVPRRAAECGAEASSPALPFSRVRVPVLQRLARFAMCAS